MTAAKLFQNDICAENFNPDSYPKNEEISNLEYNKSWLIESVEPFMETLIKYPLMQVSIGQVIASKLRPGSVICPILFGMDVGMDMFGSTILDKIFGTKLRNPVKLDRTRKV